MQGLCMLLEMMFQNNCLHDQCLTKNNHFVASHKTTAMRLLGLDFFLNHKNQNQLIEAVNAEYILKSI